MSNVGDRVGAYLSRTKTSVEFCGYGVYVGDMPCRQLGYRPNPKIQLDNGKQVWGCECWWGDEAKMQKDIAGATINDVSGQLPAFDPNDGPPADFGANCMIALNAVFADRVISVADGDVLWNGLSKTQQSVASQVATLLTDIQAQENAAQQAP